MPAIKLGRADGTHATVVGVGTTQSGAAAIVEGTNFLTSETGQTGFILPANAQAPIVCKVGTVAASIFPSTGGSINGAAANAVFSATAAKTVMLVPLNDGLGINWFAVLSA
jgi:hypothetical protein